MTGAQIDESKLEAFMGRVVGDMGAAASAPLLVVGEQLGLFRALADGGAMSADALAGRAGADARYVREWLNNLAAGGYVEYDPAADAYTLPPEHAMALADPDSPFYVLGFFESVGAFWADAPRLAEIMRTGEGMGWHEHDHHLFRGTERFFRPGYAAHLVAEWLPALDGMEERLRAGAAVADVGCGHGASTVLMAAAFPASTFTGFDSHEESIATASERAQEAGVADRVSFTVAGAKDFPGEYDLVTMFDCLHDMGDPVGASAHVRDAIAARDGACMIVEPFAGDRIEDNLHPIGRVFYAASTQVCTPASRSQEVGLALGAQAGEKRLNAVLTEGGFSHVRRATETPFNLVLEARA